jgi:hypothetical protein
MRTWLKWSGAFAVALLAGSAIAADHRDGVAAMAPDHDLDINDVYTWMSADNSEIILIMTTGGLMGATEHSDAVQYVFHVGRTDTDATALTAPAPDWTNIVCVFASPTNATCTVGTPGQEATNWVSGDVSGDMGATSDDGLMRVHAGLHADPFFFHLAGFNQARTEIVEQIAPVLTPANFEASGCIQPGVINSIPVSDPELTAKYPGQNYGQILRGLLTGANNPDPACTAACGSNTPGMYSVDTFAQNDTLALVVQLDKSLIAGTGEYFQVYASTHNTP